MYIYSSLLLYYITFSSNDKRQQLVKAVSSGWGSDIFSFLGDCRYQSLSIFFFSFWKLWKQGCGGFFLLF